MGSGENAHAEDIHIFLDRCLHDLLGRVMSPRIDYLHPRIPEGHGEDKHTAIMTAQARLAKKHTDLPFALLHISTFVSS
jgi:hypothetical protein